MRPPSPEMIPYMAANRLCLIILPTEACNFRCVYCYEEFKHGQMEAPVVQGLKRFLTRRAEGLDFLSLGWFGGEPLLARGVVEEVMEHTASLIEEHTGLECCSSMTTNGYLLTREVFQGLLSRGVTEYQISFDGPREWHDKKRVLAGGQGTFDRLWKNVSSMRSVPGRFTVDIRVHVDRENHEAMPEFIRLYSKTFEDDPRFRLFIRALSRFGGANDEEVQVLEGGLEDKRIITLREYAGALGITLHSEQDCGPVCYAAWANCFVVRADGRLNKCSLALERPENQVGRLAGDGTLELDQELSLTWMRGLFSEDEKARRCPLSNFPGREARGPGSGSPDLTRCLKNPSRTDAGP
jgi:uncharacterized protein